MDISEWQKRIIVVNRRKFSLEFYERDNEDIQYTLKREFLVSVGAKGYATPEGLYTINTKAKDPDWQVPDSDWARELGLEPGTIIDGGSPYNPLIDRWLGVTPPSEGVGIHGTLNLDSLGTRASHGCIRMAPNDVRELYDLVPKGTPIIIL